MAGGPGSGFIGTIVAAQNRRNATNSRSALRREALRLVLPLLARDPAIARIRLSASVLPGRRMRADSDPPLGVKAA